MAKVSLDRSTAPTTLLWMTVTGAVPKQVHEIRRLQMGKGGGSQGGGGSKGGGSGGGNKGGGGGGGGRPVNAPSTTGNPSGGGRGNNPPSK